MASKARTDGPAPYSHTDHSETRAISCLNDLLAHPEIKAHISQRDKAPNIDGFIELVDSSLRPLGKIEVQVKYLSAQDRRRKGYSCKLSFLHYCLKAPLPVVLIGVVPEERQAFWCEVSRTAARAALDHAGDKRKVTVRFSDENIISPGTQNHIEMWRHIVEEHSHKLLVYDSYRAEIERLRGLAARVEQVGDGFPDAKGIDFRHIQVHLDELNGLFDADFSAVKRSIFPRAWKLGFAFAEYTPTSLAYCYYPVELGANDLLIRRVSRDAFINLESEIIHYPGSNPVLEDPQGLAREFVEDEALRMVGGMSFAFDDLVLCREYLFALIDKFSDQLGISQSVESVRLKRLQSAWSDYFPAWMSYALGAMPEDKLRNILNVSLLHGFLDPGTLNFVLQALEGITRQEIVKSVREHAKAGPILQSPLPVGVRDLPLNHVDRLLASLVDRGANNLERLYTRFNYRRRGQTIASWWTHAQLLENLRLFYRELPRLHDHVVDQTFPRLRDELEYYQGFDRELIFVTARADSARPHIDFCNLRGGPQKRTDVLTEADNIPFPDAEQDRTTLSGTTYDLCTIGGGNAMFMFHPLPLLTTIRDKLKGRIRRLHRLQRAPRRVPAGTQRGQAIRISRR